MYSFAGKSQSGGASSSSVSSASLKNFEFDFGIGGGSSNRGSSRPLKDQKAPSTGTNPSSFSSSSYPQRPSSSSAAPWTPNKPSWTHQPSPAAAAAAGSRSGLSNPTSMVGDIFGKSWTSTAAPSGGGRGIRSSDSALFGDLVGPALGQTKGGSIGKVPLKSAAPASENSYSMGSLSDSLPKSTSTGGAFNPGNSQNRGSTDSWGGYFPSNGGNVGGAIGNSRGAQPMKPAGAAASAKLDPFGSLVDFGSKPSLKSSPAVGSSPASKKADDGNFSFGGSQNANPPKTAGSNSDFDGFGIPSFHDQPSKNTPPQPKVDFDPLDALFSSISSSGNTAAAAASGGGGSQTVEANDWDLGGEFGGHDSGGTTTELEGLPPPPAGVSSSTAIRKGSESYKQGQFADGIKWLSWAFLLLEKSGDTSAMAEVLTCRASCYKEVGEYKKAIADCSKVLEHDSKNVAVLVQRALLYESSEKYKLGAEDLRAVLKLDPMNRVARSTIHRLTQMAG